MFGDDGDGVSSAEPRFYGMIIHGPDPVSSERPGFIHLVFPSSNQTGYMARFDLLALAARGYSIELEEIADDLFVELADAAKERVHPRAEKERSS